MILETLYEHAKTMVKADSTGERAFVLKEVKVNVRSDDADDKFTLERRIADAGSGAKISVPLIFHGDIEILSISRLKISNSGNASNSTFKKLKDKPLPPEWFPWAKEGIKAGKVSFSSSAFLDLIDKINGASHDELRKLFKEGGALASFDDFSPEELDEKVAKTLCLPTSCKSPKTFSHAILGLNALFNVCDEKDRLSNDCWGELWRFALLFWVLDMAEKQIELETDDGRYLEIDKADVRAGGTTAGDISKLNLTCRLSDLLIGGKVAGFHHDNPVLSRWADLAKEDDPSLIVLGNKNYTAPSTGKSPTNAQMDHEGKNILGDVVRKGFEESKFLEVLDGYTPLVQETALSLDENLLYYVYPDLGDEIEEYLVFLKRTIKKIKKTRGFYFKAINIKSENKKKEEIEKTRRQLAEEYRAFWNELNDMDIYGLMLCFEENVGSSNQQQYAWTSVYRGQSVLRIFLLLYLLNSPDEEFSFVSQMLKKTSQSMGVKWTAREKRYLIDTFINKKYTDMGDYWIRWRKYLARSDASEKSNEKKRLWKNSMSFIMTLKTIDCMEDLKTDDLSGDELLESFNKRRKTMANTRKNDILGYLEKIFRPEESSNPKNKAKIDSMLDRCAEEYAFFVDTDSENWKPIIDGLICGWGLKGICFKLRKDDYQSVIGGRSLIRQQPDEIRTLTINLLEKARRSDQTVWLIDRPMEILLSWAGRATTTDERTRLFVDSLAFGFMRDDGFSKKID